MSCFHVSSLHIATIAAYAAIDMKLDPLPVAQALQRLNNASMRARYGDKPVSFGASILVGCKGITAKDRKTVAIDRGIRQLASIDGAAARAAYVYRLCECLDYQCSEASENHPARATLARIMKHAAESGAECLPQFAHIWSI